MANNRRTSLLTTALLLVLVLPSLTAAQQPADLESVVVAANTRFAFKLFQSIVSKSEKQNVLLAPTGLSLSFALLDNGADANTRKEIENALEFSGLDLPEINQGFSSLREDLQLRRTKLTKRPDWMTPTQWKSYRSAPPNGILVADSIWLKGITLPRSFVEVDNQDFGVEVKQLSATVAPSIQFSRWAYERTKKQVTIELGRIERDDFVLVDVTYFHSFWEHAFSENDTKPGPFTLPDGSKKEALFMHQRNQFRYFEDPEFQAVVLPYRAESMYVFLPAAGSTLQQFEQKLTSASWGEWLSRFESREGVVGLPRMQVESKSDIRSALHGIGLRRVFDTFESLSPLVPVIGAKLTSVSQSTALKVDERGTEAISIGILGGVAGGVQGGRLGQPPPPFEMIINRPFFFAIVNEHTKQLIFLGAVTCPNC